MSAQTQQVRPFTIETSDADLEELRARVAATRWPEKETVTDQSQGVPIKTAQQWPAIGLTATTGVSVRPG